ncbi:MAG: hypothetical protein V4567_05245 [Pseudomonadota bacterium]
MPKLTPNSFSNRFGIAAFALPSAALLAFVLAYARSFPIWETWYFIPVWRDFNEHGAWFSDLFINRWGHISAIPNFLNLMLDHLSGYDQRVDILVSAIFAIAALFLLLRYYVPREAVLARVFLGLTFLSLRVAEIWLDGWNTVMTLSLLLSIAAGACVLATSSWKGLLACALLAFLGLNSGGYCLAVLPAVLIVLLMQTWQGRRAPVQRGLAQALVWIGWVAALLWYWRWMADDRDVGPGAVMHKLLEPGALTLFGHIHALMLGDRWIGALALAGALIVFLVSIIRTNWRQFASLPALPALAYMVVYSTVLTALIETARTVNGTEPLHLRYVPFLCLLPVALLAFSECLATPGPNPAAGHVSTVRQGVWPPVVKLVLCAFIASAIWNDIHYYRYQSRPNQPQLAALDRAWQQTPWMLTPGMFLYRAATDPELVAQGLKTMRELRIGPFGRVSPVKPYPSLAENNRDEDIRFIINQMIRNPDGNWVVQGWAFDTRRDIPIPDVYGQLGRCSETALSGMPRPDIAAFFKTPHAKTSGWMLTFPASCAGSPHPAIKIHFVEKNGRWNAAEKQP